MMGTKCKSTVLLWLILEAMHFSVCDSHKTESTLDHNDLPSRRKLTLFNLFSGLFQEDFDNLEQCHIEKSQVCEHAVESSSDAAYDAIYDRFVNGGEESTTRTAKYYAGPSKSIFSVNAETRKHKKPPKHHSDREDKEDEEEPKLFKVILSTVLSPGTDGIVKLASEKFEASLDKIFPKRSAMSAIANLLNDSPFDLGLFSLDKYDFNPDSRIGLELISVAVLVPLAVLILLEIARRLVPGLVPVRGIEFIIETFRLIFSLLFPTLTPPNSDNRGPLDRMLLSDKEPSKRALALLPNLGDGQVRDAVKIAESQLTETMEEIQNLLDSMYADGIEDAGHTIDELECRLEALYCLRSKSLKEAMSIAI